MKPKQILTDLKLAQQIAKYPNFPTNAIPQPKYSDKTANGLTKMIIDFIQLMGGQAERINTMGRVIAGKTKIDFHTGKVTKDNTYIPTTGTKGSADISATVKGRSVKIEIKIGKDRQSERQKNYEENITNAGGVYYIARDFDSFYHWYTETFI
jgi:hypothetical protein